MRNPANKQTNKQTNRHTKVIAISRFTRDKNLLDKREKVQPKFQLNDLVRTADLKKKRFQKEIRLIGLINYINLQNLLMIQYQVIK